MAKSATDLEDKVGTLSRELTAAIEQQSAASQILRVIQQSPQDVQPVFQAIAESAARLCSAEFSSVYTFNGELIHFAAHHGLSAQAVKAMKSVYPLAPSRGTAVARSILNGKVEEIPDIQADADYRAPTLANIAGQSIAAVPMLKDGRPIGSIAVARPLTGYFPERQIKLLETFADQAVIAIENARLFKEVETRTRDLSESLEQQTAASEILRVIASSPTKVEPVFESIAESAARLCSAQFCFVHRFDGRLLHFAAQYGATPEAIQAIRAVFPMAPGRWNCLRFLPTKLSSPSKTRGCSRKERQRHANLPAHLSNCGPLRVASFKQKSSPLSVN